MSNECQFCREWEEVRKSLEDDVEKFKGFEQYVSVIYICQCLINSHV